VVVVGDDTIDLSLQGYSTIHKGAGTDDHLHLRPHDIKDDHHPLGFRRIGDEQSGDLEQHCKILYTRTHVGMWWLRVAMLDSERRMNSHSPQAAKGRMNYCRIGSEYNPIRREREESNQQ